MQGITNVEEAASKISEELKEKNYLIILDEVWDMIDLNELMTITRTTMSCRLLMLGKCSKKK